MPQKHGYPQVIYGDRRVNSSWEEKIERAFRKSILFYFCKHVVPKWSWIPKRPGHMVLRLFEYCLNACAIIQ